MERLSVVLNDVEVEEVLDVLWPRSSMSFATAGSKYVLESIGVEKSEKVTNFFHETGKRGIVFFYRFDGKMIGA